MVYLVKAVNFEEYIMPFGELGDRMRFEYAISQLRSIIVSQVS